MKYIVLTSDKHNFLLEGYSILFQKYWNPDLPVTVLGFDKPKVDLPDNFTFVSMGQQKDYPTWEQPLREYLESISDEYFFMAFEDHYLVDHVMTELFYEGLFYCHESKGEIDKMYLTIDNRRIDSHYEGSFYNTVDVPNSLVTTSLLPSVWRREYFLSLLEPGMRTPHDFEIRLNSRKLNCKTIQSKHIIYPNVDCYRQGKFNHKVFSQFKAKGSYSYGIYDQPMKQEDIEVFKLMEKRNVQR